MRGIKIKTKASRATGRETLPVVTFLLLLAGVFGVLLLFRSPAGITFPLWAVFPVTAGLCWALWYSFPRYRGLFYAILVGSLLLCGLFAFYLREDLWEQILHVRRSLRGGTQQMEMTLLAMLAAVLLTLLLFTLECWVKCHTPAFLLTMALLLLSPLLGIDADLGTVFLLLLFMLAFGVVRVASKQGKKGSLLTGKSRLAGKSAIAFALILALVFLAVIPLASHFSNTLYDSVYMAEDFVRGNLRHLTGKASKPVTGGKISTGNNYRFGTEHLYLTTNMLPTETLYLRGFSGGEYLGGDWAETKDTDILYQMGVLEPAEDIPVEDTWDFTGRPIVYPSSISLWGLFPWMYFELNSQLSGAWDTVFLAVQHCNDTYENAYEPYYSSRQSGWITDGFDTVFAADQWGYSFLYYQQKDMQIDWERLTLMQGLSVFLSMRESFAQQVQEVYTQVPKELVPRLTALAKEMPLTDLDEITAYILYTLHSNTTYTLSPGWSSFNQDITECFLFERGKGFCEHYAATATLLYRLYGIPARYATGYMVSPSAFTQQADGSYSAVVTDESAHAWVEIFLKDYGWTPVEVTPTADGYTVVSYPGFDTLRLHQIWQEHGWDVSIPSFSLKNKKDPSSEGQTPDSPASVGSSIEPGVLLLIPLMGLCYAVLLLPLYAVKRRTRRLQMLNGWGCREVFCQLLEALRFGGLLPECSGSEPDFALQLAGCVPAVSREEAEALIDILNEAAFGPPKQDKEKDAFVRSVYNRAADEVYGKLSRRKKLIFKWIKVFG
ncbi:MAG: hypothetical protein J1E00_06390 [Oscillospiraceae bacterium]|nr:hypothetical protein [Oscillospiraceae bacterium]